MKRESEAASSWQIMPLKPQLVPLPPPRNPQYGPVAQPGSQAMPLSEWLRQKSRTLAKTAEYVAVGVLAIGVAAVVVLVVVGTANAGSGGTKKKDAMT